MRLLYTNVEDCCACKACANACAQNAISFEYDKFGFAYPIINEEKCVNCGRCERVCDFGNKDDVVERNLPIKGFAAVHTDDNVLKRSSSGGVFSALAEWIISRGGFVYGCVLDEKLMPVFDCAREIERTKKMCGSKYVQSDPGYVYRDVKEKLMTGKPVLFTGTPCQVAALYSYLGKRYLENLYTADLICHGTPSPLLYKEYLHILEKKLDGKILGIRFRNKRRGWAGQFLLEIEVTLRKPRSNKIQTKYIHYEESMYFMEFLLKNLSRPSKYNCKYASRYRVGDISMGDFWSFRQADIKLDYHKGLSSVLVNTKKGESLISRINLKLEEVALDKILKGTSNLNSPGSKGPKWDYYMDGFAEGKLEDLMTKYESDHKKQIFLAKIKKHIPVGIFEFLKFKVVKR